MILCINQYTQLALYKYKEEYKKDFKKINVEWGEKMFTVEPYDLEVLENPKKNILDKKGLLFF